MVSVLLCVPCFFFLFLILLESRFFLTIVVDFRFLTEVTGCNDGTDALGVAGEATVSALGLETLVWSIFRALTVLTAPAPDSAGVSSFLSPALSLSLLLCPGDPARRV